MVNNVTLLGRITRDPEVKAVGNGSAVCNFTLAVNRNFKNQQGEYEADFINVVAFGNTASRMQQYVNKGNLLAITGRIQTRNYENNMGQRVYVTEVVANNVSFVESRSTRGQNNAQASYGAQSPYDMMGDDSNQAPSNNSFNSGAINDFSDIDDDDLPF